MVRPSISKLEYFTSFSPLDQARVRAAVQLQVLSRDVAGLRAAQERARVAEFHRIAEACSGLDLQLVISLGGRRDPAMFSDLPGKPLVVGNAPQLELLKRAQIVISHAGPNTVLETLMQGKPLLALPMALDQPAVAARLAALGVAEVLRVENRSTEQLRAALLKVQNDPSYRDAAQKLQSQMQSLRGLERAARHFRI